MWGDSIRQPQNNIPNTLLLRTTRPPVPSYKIVYIDNKDLYSIIYTNPEKLSNYYRDVSIIVKDIKEVC